MLNAKVSACGFNVTLTIEETKVFRKARQGKADVHKLNEILNNNYEINCAFEKIFKMWSEENIKAFFWYRIQTDEEIFMTWDEFNEYLAIEHQEDWSTEAGLMRLQEEADPEDYGITIKEDN